MKHRQAIAAGRFLVDALSGKLGVPMMVMAYVTLSVVLLAYVSTQVYTASLMEANTQRGRTKLALQERVGVLTAQYTTMTSKSRISRRCEDAMGMVSATSNDVVRVMVDVAEPRSPERSGVFVDPASGAAIGELSRAVER